MAKPNWHYHRDKLARHYLQSVELGMMNRMALLGVRRVGKTAFLLQDLCPIAIEQGYLPIYVNLWASRERPHETFLHVLQTTLANITNKGALASMLGAEVKKLEVGNSFLGKMGLEFGQQVPLIGHEDLILIAQLLEKLVETKGCKPLLIIDEIQHLAQSPAFLPLQSALRTSFDTLSDRLPIIYAGSSRSGIQAMFSDNKMPFYNSAFMVEFPVLDKAFVHHCHALMVEYFDLDVDVKALEVVHTQTFDYSPFWFSKLVQHLIMNKCSVAQATEIVCAQIILDGGFEPLSRSLKPIDKAVLITIKEGKGKLYADETLQMICQRFSLMIKPSGMTAALKKLQRRQLISQVGRSDYIVENAGFVDYLVRALEQSASL
jgi:hypothetical protein